MARSSLRSRVGRRPIVIMHRGGGGQGSDLPTGCYVASAFGGPADLQLVLTDGKVTTVAAKPNRAWDEFDYAEGAFTAGLGGYGWNGSWAVRVPYLRAVALDSFEAYNDGAFAGTGGSGWSGGFTVASY